VQLPPNMNGECMTEKKNTWTIEELVALTDEVQTGVVEFQGKNLNVQWCELTEAEEPKVKLPSGDASVEESNKAYQDIAVARVLEMITKANTKNPDGKTLTKEIWEKLPSTVRWNVSSVIIGGGQDVSANFRELDETST